MDTALFRNIASDIAAGLPTLTASAFVEPFEGSYRIYATDQYGGITDKDCSFVYVRNNGGITYAPIDTQGCGDYVQLFTAELIIVAGSYEVTSAVELNRLVTAAFLNLPSYKSDYYQVVNKRLVSSEFNYEDVIDGEFLLKERTGLSLCKVIVKVIGHYYPTHCPCELPADCNNYTIYPNFTPVP
jgi:hypothetical protein